MTNRAVLRSWGTAFCLVLYKTNKKVIKILGFSWLFITKVLPLHCQYKKSVSPMTKTSKLVAELTARGCRKVRSGGNHDIWKSPITGNCFAVPRHPSREVPTGTERNIRRASGVYRKD